MLFLIVRFRKLRNKKIYSIRRYRFKKKYLKNYIFIIFLVIRQNKKKSVTRKHINGFFKVFTVKLCNFNRIYIYIYIYIISEWIHHSVLGIARQNYYHPATVDHTSYQHWAPSARYLPLFSLLKDLRSLLATWEIVTDRLAVVIPWRIHALEHLQRLCVAQGHMLVV